MARGRGRCAEPLAPVGHSLFQRIAGSRSTQCRKCGDIRGPVHWTMSVRSGPDCRVAAAPRLAWAACARQFPRQVTFLVRSYKESDIRGEFLPLTPTCPCASLPASAHAAPAGPSLLRSTRLEPPRVSARAAARTVGGERDGHGPQAAARTSGPPPSIRKPLTRRSAEVATASLAGCPATHRTSHPTRRRYRWPRSMWRRRS